MRKIVAIGGGSMLEGATAGIHKEIVSLAEKKNPEALFIPTASSDEPVYYEIFRKVYGNRLGCTTRTLLLLKDPPSYKTISQKIDNADIIYVGGGNTLKMMRRWRHLGVDRMLINACKRGKVMAGVSAGAICWFNYGHSDSLFYYHPDNWNWIRVRCLGVLPFIACPHYLKEHRDKHFQEMILQKGGTGIAIDDEAAFEVIDDQFRIIGSKNSRAFKVYRKEGKIFNEPFPFDKKFRPLTSVKAE